MYLLFQLFRAAKICCSNPSEVKLLLRKKEEFCTTNQKLW